MTSDYLWYLRLLVIFFSKLLFSKSFLQKYLSLLQSEINENTGLPDSGIEKAHTKVLASTMPVNNFGIL